MSSDGLTTHLCPKYVYLSASVHKFCSVEDKKWGIIIEDSPYIICSTFKIKWPRKLKANDKNMKF
jgi:hypothetical protein